MPPPPSYVSIVAPRNHIRCFIIAPCQGLNSHREAEPMQQGEEKHTSRRTRRNTDTAQNEHDVNRSAAYARQQAASRPQSPYTDSQGNPFRQAPDLSKTEDIIRVRKKSKQIGKKKKALLITLMVLLAVIGLSGGAIALYLDSLNQAMSFQNKQEEIELKAALAEPTVMTKEAPFYMLVLGSDARDISEASRSDVMILLRIDPQSNQITMISIPRDTMVDIPGHGRSKINAAYAYGGAAGAVDAVTKFANVPITHYAEIHFQELEALVDALGGVWVNVPASNDQTGSSNTGVTLNAGEQLLNGKQALALARERYGYVRGDFQRADNQKLILQAIVKQVLAQQPLELPGTIQKLSKSVTTDYTIADIIILAQTFQSTGKVIIYSATVPSSTMTINGASYAITDQAAWSAMMQKVSAGGDPNV